MELNIPPFVFRVEDLQSLEAFKLERLCLPLTISTMIHSLFLINSSGDIFLEKHWKSVVSRSVCDYFFEAQEKATEAENVPPVIPTPHHYLLSVYRHKIFFVAVIQTEVPPLFVIEFLHRVVDTFQVSEHGRVSVCKLRSIFMVLFPVYLVSVKILGAPSLGPPPTLGAVFSHFPLFYLNKLSRFTL
jgi:hypothetical protein